jgi:acyl-coenzyme A thioesterase PaaI-like protein
MDFRPKISDNIAMAEQLSLQQRFSPASICFGCGPANKKGLRINSFPEGDEVVAEWRAEPHHQAFPGMLNGGIIGALLDCHSNWTAAWFLMTRDGKREPDCTVTADFHVKLLRPTPSGAVIHLKAKVMESREDRATVDAELITNDKVCATCRGTFVAVKEGHPAYHRW